MTRARLVRRNGRQVLCLPDAAAFPPSVETVAVLRDGSRRVLVPVEALWDDFFASPGIDFPDRTQPAATRREAL